MSSGRRGKGIGGHQRPNRGGSDTWLTPRWILDRLGRFDLDPCPSLPQPWPTAAGVIEGDGLAAEWAGRVWLNPPYGPDLGKWLRRLADHGCGTAICFARTETAAFFSAVWGRASAVLFLKGRVTFCYPDGTAAAANGGAPSVLIAYGSGDAWAMRKSGIPGAWVPGSAVRVQQTPDLFGLVPGVPS